MSQLTYGHLKEKVLDCLFEHEHENGETVLLDNARSAAVSRMPDVVYHCLVRMFETFSVGRKTAILEFTESEKNGYVKAALPSDFKCFDEKNGFCGVSCFYTENGYVFFADNLFYHGSTVRVIYRALPPVITDKTDEGFVFEISPLAFEVLVCLCALELCRAEDTSLYTKLYHKYSDLSMGLCEPLPTVRRNSFYTANSKKRWTR